MTLCICHGIWAAGASILQCINHKEISLNDDACLCHFVMPCKRHHICNLHQVTGSNSTGALKQLKGGAQRCRQDRMAGDANASPFAARCQRSNASLQCINDPELMVKQSQVYHLQGAERNCFIRSIMINAGAV
ncbi:hypothetical protein PYCCODRAFT_443139 [Trametes coccinea BRFM310]|uniref:Uncharacterized protein n=1 Tax=Trametes coccinea (strain BRFM310) TaxID=1353009 RepID=A0A1Y2INA7_TRAC3|nr:hypothetical protein PYCCODRAFT_443139 [Trametes coccinea BRFM310]